MYKRAFTIVEVAIAAAVVAILASAAVPRLNELLDRQEFAQSAQAVSSCIQEAQGRAAAPNRADYTESASSATGLARWISAEITTTVVSGVSTTTCRVAAYGSEIARASLTASSPTTSLFITSPSYSSTKSLVVSDQRLYFGVSEGGTLQRIVIGATIRDASTNSGLREVVNVASPVRSDLLGSVIIPFNGSPVTYKAQ